VRLSTQASNQTPRAGAGQKRCMGGVRVCNR
jgi:hypothetical protein